MISGPIFLIQPNGITYSPSLPSIPQIFPGTGMMIARTFPSQTSISTSTTQPSLLQLHILITSFSLSSQSLTPHTRFPEIRSAAIKSACIQQQPSYCYYMQAPSLCEMLCLKQSLFCHYLFTFKCFCDYRNQYHSQDQCLCQCHRILHHTHISCKNSL